MCVIPPEAFETERVIAEAAACDDAIFTSSAPSISTPPALADKLIASALARPDVNVIPPTSDSSSTESAPVP